MKKVSFFKLEDGTNMISIWDQKGKEISNIIQLREIELGVFKRD